MMTRWLRKLRLFGRFKFTDAQAMAKSDPENFLCPTYVELALLDVGDIVKVCIGEEQFWTVIQSINDHKITASIDNELQHTEEHGLSIDDLIRFEKRHIHAIYE